MRNAVDAGRAKLLRSLQSTGAEFAERKNSTAGSDAGGGLVSPFTYVAYALIEVQNGCGICQRILACSERAHGRCAFEIVWQRRWSELVAPECVRGQVVGWG
ncbi:MAG: hypothetical protein RR857_08125 [Comamonas sp.]